MKKLIKLVCSTLLIATVFIAGVVHASEKKTFATPPATLKKKFTSVLVPLTKQECGNLGGVVLSDNGTGVCNSGEVCVTKDQNNQLHRVCISAQ
jgi:hypothetical protein